MEIIDYLHIARQRLWVLILVPVLAGAIVAAAVLLGTQTYTANAVVAAPALIGGSASNQYNGPQGVSQFAAAFTAATQAPSVLKTVSDKTHVSTTDLTDGLTVTQLGSSSQMEVTYETTNAKTAGPVASAMADATLDFLFSPQVALAQKQVDAATAAVVDADKAIAAWSAKNGSAAPDKLYDTKVQQINSLQQQQLTLAANGSATAAAALGTAIQNQQAQLRQLAPLVGDYQQLVDKKTVAMGSLAAAQQSLQGARAQSAAAAPSNVVDVSSTQAVARLPLLVKKVAPAVGAGLFLAIGLVIVLEMLARRRSRMPYAAHGTAPLPSQGFLGRDAAELTGVRK